MKKFITHIIFATAFIGSLQQFSAQKVVVNREVETQKDGKMLLGVQTKDQFTKVPYADWYTKEHDEYALDQKAISELKKRKINSYNLIVFMGTWCEDSHRDFPRLMKILEEVKYPEDKMTIIAVNRKKESPSGEEATYNIQKVPTIIVQKYGKEIGRIIEMPTTGYVERDLVEILNKDDQSVIKEIFK
ncbi:MULTISPECIES: TlpA family protein disulfide reductase [Chryseobacterium]|uniref:Thiol-disulfide isomerase/thioredoxin n=1 Tax=Chryseobacterium camelliae TaxID=1265445 RepID=A0ABU0TGL8_9FLAO|nr:MULTISPECIES: thioredoxin family protein [Chryseobacterium]MDT3405996.1 thiol-disulfide isomerase/thioredoxin [Pseudacidovorax intermedius]MDQ1096203.1 thiol-disulfide isomerase/thioredoxin [Chryseobacterium camelliae]MDQ1100140.1 thiol-disulfide isomerase/thioredoxin [Chryseobacterium sp. SORGH_AS_1048]MDR6087483.1 thiol-disulfide isomerase/thioredoxin [Chryseobacterium sp. SORGH_AS_0909]MDR6131857.1 thiol-disulfide isomerase/thioredoxin [Chryseobacterium sp. SORGH_AS_1175]